MVLSAEGRECYLSVCAGCGDVTGVCNKKMPRIQEQKKDVARNGPRYQSEEHETTNKQFSYSNVVL